MTQYVCGQYVGGCMKLNKAGINNRIITCADTSYKQPADKRQDNIGTLMCTSYGQ